MTSSNKADRVSDQNKAPLESGKHAVLYRLATGNHLCPFGLKSLSLLKREGFELEDRSLTSREQAEDFKQKHGVETTPQTFINGERIGGYEDLKRHLGKPVRADKETTYSPIIAIFSMTALAAFALVYNMGVGFDFTIWVKWFVALTMAVLAIQKLQDLGGFVNGFLGYDLLARRYVPYGYAYPFLEAYAAVGMIGLIGSGSNLVWLVAPVSLFIGTVGAVSVIKAVYVDKRDLTCACVGGGSNVPLGLVSLTENLMMVLMGGWMLAAS